MPQVGQRGAGFYLGRLLLTVLGGALVFLLARWATEATSLEQRFDDVLTRTMPVAPPGEELLIVGVDQDAIHAYGSWPFAAEHIVALAEALAEAGAKAVVFVDPVLGPETGADQIHRLRVLEPDCLVAVPRAMREDPFDSQRLHPVVAREDSVARLGAGISIVDPDADGVVRRLALGWRLGNEVVPCQMLDVARRLLGDEADLPQPDPDASLAIRFTGQPRSRAAVAPRAVLEGKVGDGVIAERICLVGLYEPGLIGNLTTPFSAAPLYTAPVEVHTAALDTLLQGRYGGGLPDCLNLLGAVVITLWLTLTWRALRPMGILILMLVYVIVVPVAGGLVQHYLYFDVPVLAFVILGVTALLGSLIVQLVRYQDDLLSLLTVLQRTHWLLPADFDRRALSDEGLAALADSIGELIHSQGVILARSGRGFRDGRRLAVVAVAGFGAETAPKVGDLLEAIPVDEVAVIDGDLLFPGLHGRLWAVPIRGAGGTAGWLLARMEDMTRLRQSEVMVQGLTRHLLGLLEPRDHLRSWRLPDLAIFRLLRSHYLSDITDRLEGLQERDRKEREIMTLMLDVTQVGLVLADSVGRVLYRNRFCDQAFGETRLAWNGESAIELLRTIAARQKADEDRRIVDCFRAGRGRTFTLTGKGEQADTYMIQVWPFLHDPAEAEDEEVGFRSMAGDTMTIGRMPSWPDHFIIAISNVTAFQHVDKLKSELIEMIAFKCRNHMSSILVCSDLLKSEPTMAPEIVPELRRTAASLDTIFEQFRASAQFSIDYQHLNTAVPLNLHRVLIECLTELRHLADRQEVAFDLQKGEVLESAFVAEGPLRKAMTDLIQACLHASRPKQVITIGLVEGSDHVVIDMLLPQCTLLVALRRFPVSHLEGLPEYDSFFGQQAEPDDLSLQAAALMPDVHNNLKGAKCHFRAYEHGEQGLRFRIQVPQLV